MNKIQIFSTSLNPDVYINAIIHFVHEEHKENDNHKTDIEIIIVFPNATDLNKQKPKYEKLSQEIKQIIENLAKGEYLIKNHEGSTKQTIELGESQKEFYQFAQNKINSYDPKFIIYKDLENEVVDRISQSKSNYKYVFDLTGERKYLLVDILFICLENEFEQLFVFDMLKAPNYGQKEENLIHSLDSHEYEYRNLLESKYAKKFLSKLTTSNDANNSDTNYKDQLIEEKVKSWRQASNFYLLLGAFVFIVGVLILLSYANWDTNQAYLIFEKWKQNLLGLIISFVGMIMLGYFVKLWYDKRYNNANIQNFKKGLLEKL